MAGWALYACSTPYALELAETIWRRGEEVAVLVDNLPAGVERRIDADAIGAPVLAPDELSAEQRRLAAAIPLITPGHRFAVEREARARGLDSFPALVDPTAVVARSAEVGEGTAVNAASVLAGGASAGRFVHVNRTASVGHHSRLEDYSTLGPGCVLGGHVTIGRGAFVGAGAVCSPEVTVGANAIVGAGAVVTGDVPPGAVVVGNPARALPGRSGGYGGASVPE